ncbi:10882_t:CDS:1 [Cetraspora pellucida]|uniref:10882_t:CDS:1 n=1 Tax=Cetraspora pellucida TaxID=1433469 RepID=A0ACA9MML8_9GLOM|nr:10882_t:CDS:1 [Cetraspora pellucida]
MKKKIKTNLFHDNIDKPNKLFCNVCNTSFVHYSSESNLRKHFRKFHKKELEEFDIPNIIIENQRTYRIDRNSDNISLSGYSQTSDIDNIKEIMKGFEGRGEIEAGGIRMKFEGKFK